MCLPACVCPSPKSMTDPWIIKGCMYLTYAELIYNMKVQQIIALNVQMHSTVIKISVFISRGHPFEKMPKVLDSCHFWFLLLSFTHKTHLNAFLCFVGNIFAAFT